MGRKGLLNGRVLTAAVMLAIFVTMSLIAFSMSAEARLMPLIVGVMGSLLALIQVFEELRTVTIESPESGRKAADKRRSERHMFAWVFLFFVGILAFGFVYAAPTLVFGFLSIGKKESTKVALAGAAGIWVLTGLFERWFEIQLFTGLFVEWLLG
jgi:hypothetical protein